MAIPPAHRAGIVFDPALPAEYEKLAQHWPQGKLSKAYAAYDTPFWRANGCSGEALSDEGPVFITFDVSPADDGPGILLGFTDARTFDPLPAADRRDRALAGFATFFGDAALHPIDYVDHCWGTEEFAPGGPTAAVPPGSWTTYGPWLRKPVDGIVWAGTETADKWTGFLDGAVRSGKRAAAEVAPAAVRSRLGAGPTLLGHRLDERPQLLVDLLRTLEDRAVAAGHLDECDQVRCRVGDPARRGDRQQPVLLAADHQRRHGEVAAARCAARPANRPAPWPSHRGPAGGVAANSS